MLKLDIERGMPGILALVDHTASDHQAGAMASLVYNIGLQAFKGSSVLRLHKAGDHDAAARAFGLRNKAKVKNVSTVLPGLTARRAAEAAAYLQLDDDEPANPMPQAVQAESSLLASPINQAGAGVSVTGALGLMNQYGDQATGAISTVQSGCLIYRCLPPDRAGCRRPRPWCRGHRLPNPPTQKRVGVMDLKKVLPPAPPPAPEWKAHGDGFEINAKGQLRTRHQLPLTQDQQTYIDIFRRTIAP